MAYDNRTNTITVGDNSDFLVDSGAFHINLLRTLAEENDPSPQMLNDWRVIEKWLQCTGRPLNHKDNEKIGRAWRAYIAIGVAPSDKLQISFSTLSDNYKQQGLSFISDKPPTEVMDVFDRLMATDDEIKKKRPRDHEVEKKKIETMLKKSPSTKIIKSWLETLSKNKRIFIAFVIAWAAWVIVRTSGHYYGILGVELDRWDEEMFLVNLVLPPAFVWAAYSIFNWIKRAEK